MITPSLAFRSLALASALASTLAMSCAASAHDFWLSPDTYSVAPDTTVNVSVLIGHPDEKTHWPLTPHRVIALRSIGANTLTDHQDAIADYAPNKALPIHLVSPGSHMLSIETTHAFSELEAERFNAYVEEEGLRSVAIDRARKGTQDTPGREIYSRRGKVIIDVGDVSASDTAALTQPLGLTLEIVPLAHPGTLSDDQELSANVFYRGRQLNGATVNLVKLDGDSGRVASGITDAQGRIAFAHPGKGQWMLHTVWSDPLETEEADFDTVFSSLSFEMD